MFGSRREWYLFFFLLVLGGRGWLLLLGWREGLYALGLRGWAGAATSILGHGRRGAAFGALAVGVEARALGLAGVAAGEAGLPWQ